VVVEVGLLRLLLLLCDCTDTGYTVSGVVVGDGDDAMVAAIMVARGVWSCTVELSESDMFAGGGAGAQLAAKVEIRF